MKRHHAAMPSFLECELFRKRFKPSLQSRKLGGDATNFRCSPFRLRQVEVDSKEASLRQGGDLARETQSVGILLRTKVGEI